MRYEIKKILSCKILMISMIVAFIFSMAISYNAYANEKIDLREFSAYIGDFSERKYDVIEQKVMELQNEYEETQNVDVMDEMFVYLTLDKDALNCHNVVEYRDSVISDSEIKIKTESGYYKRMNETINKLYGKKTNLVIGESETLNEVYDLFCVTDIVDIVFIIVIILFSSFLFLNEHNNNTFYMIKSSYRGGKLSYRNKIVVTLFFSIMASVVETLGMTIWSVFWNKIDQWNTSILLNNAFLHSPYSITLFEMIIVVVIMRAIGFFVLSSVFIFVSLFFKSNIVPIAINTFIGLGGIAINYILSGKYFALSGGTIREAENYDILIKVFGEKNANIAIEECIENLYKEMDRRFGSFWDDFFDEISQSHDMTVEVENRKESIEQCCSKAMQKIRRCHEIEERILENYRLALEESRVQNHEKCKSKRM